jgi:hypothetical protein
MKVNKNKPYKFLLKQVILETIILEQKVVRTRGKKKLSELKLLEQKLSKIAKTIFLNRLLGQESSPQVQVRTLFLGCYMRQRNDAKTLAVTTLCRTIRSASQHNNTQSEG